MDEPSLISDLQMVFSRVQDLRELKGFESHFRLPKKVDSAARQFLYQIGSREISEDLDQKLTFFRRLFGFKRKEQEAEGPIDGQASLSTPLFDYYVELDFLSDDPTQVQWRRCFARFKDLRIFDRLDCEQLHQNDSIELSVQVAKPLDLEAMVDSIEESDSPQWVLDYDKLVTWFEIGIFGRPEALRFTSDKISMLVESQNNRLADLIDSWLLIHQQLKATLNAASKQPSVATDLIDGARFTI